MKKYLLRILGGLLLELAGVFPAWTQNFIHVNQVGYLTSAPKLALLTDMDADAYTIRVARNNQVAFSGSVVPQQFWNLSGEQVQFIDFSSFKKPGKYYIQIGSEKSFTFAISDSAVYDSLSLWSLKAFYLWRAGCPIQKQFATKGAHSFQWPAGHPDTVVYIHRGVATDFRHIESEVSSPKGWYDAGDYNKYVVNAGFSTHFLSMAYQLFPDYYRKLNLVLPESGNGVPDILNELKWEYDWLLSMQDPYDGGVYFKLTSLSFGRMVMPAQDVSDRYMVGKCTSSALEFAAAMAVASRLFAPYNSVFPGFSAKTLKAAKFAYQWALKNPAVPFVPPADVTTGGYEDTKYTDEFFLAQSELFLSTGEKAYYDKLNFSLPFSTPLWHEVASVGLMDLVINLKHLPAFVDKDKVLSKFRSLSDNVFKLYFYNEGKVPLKKFRWGSNGEVATNGAILGLAYSTFNDANYFKGALAAFDYLLGRNSLDYCFVTGFGSRYPSHIHDRRSVALDSDYPLPGYLVGGPSKDELSDCGQQNYPSWVYPARAYLDEVCSYSTNEIAINWNASLVLLVGQMVNWLH